MARSNKMWNCKDISRKAKLRIISTRIFFLFVTSVFTLHDECNFLLLIRFHIHPTHHHKLGCKISHGKFFFKEIYGFASND